MKRLPSMETREVARIGIVARRFSELQGLRLVVLAPTMMVAFWVQPYIRHLRYAGPVEAVAGLLASVLPLLLALTSRAYFNAYYRNRFGSVASTAEHRVQDWGPAVLLLVAGIGLELNAPREGVPSFILLATALIALQITVRDWPFRTHYLPVAIGCGVAAGLRAVIPAMQADALPEIGRTSISLALALFMAPAYFDHRLLVRTLPANPAAALEAAEFPE